MCRYIYVNGSYKPYKEAAIHAEDRGFVFADAVYEVCEIRSGKLIDTPRHLKRLQRSLNEISIPIDHSIKSILMIMRETVRRNRVHNGLLYLQISRGRAPRNFIFPTIDTVSPTLVCWARSVLPALNEAKAQKGIRVKTMPDIRWQRPDIKTVGLLASVLARQAAIEEQAEEAWFYDQDKMITEGAASNAWIINAKRELITHPVDNHILKGVTREVVKDICSNLDLSLQERKFSIEEAYKAKEAFITAASALIMPVTQIDHCQIDNGKPGSVSLELRRLFHQFAVVDI